MTPEYQVYLAKLVDYLSINGFQLSRDVEVGGYRADVVGLREKFGFSLFSAPKKQFVCFLTYQPNASVALANAFTESSESMARLRYWSGGMHAQLVFPVIVSLKFDPDIVQFVENFEPKYLSREVARFPHPVFVELETKSVYHRKDLMMGAFGYRNLINKFVRDAFTP
ncbi:MAG TPA: hypothetical protein VKF15_08375 [Nitrososphaerales archaeon]|nr:hypothetical protein [Nitrososphaerales archaeon]